jgi:hypothetical protein
VGRIFKADHQCGNPRLMAGILFARPLVMQDYHSGDYEISIEHFWFRLNG